MFGFLKDKIKSALGKFTKEVEKDAKVETKEVIVEKPKTETPKKEIVKKPVEKKIQKPTVIQTKKPISKPIPTSKKTSEEKKDTSSKKSQEKIEKPVEKKKPQVEKKNSQKNNTEITKVKKEEISEEKKEPEKKGFFARLFSKSPETKELKKEEPVKLEETQDIIDSKEDLRERAEASDIEPEQDTKKYESKIELVETEVEDQESEIEEDKKYEEEYYEDSKSIVDKEVSEETEEVENEESEEKIVEEESQEEETLVDEISEEQAEEDVESEEQELKETKEQKISEITAEKKKSRYEILEEERSKKVIDEKEPEKKGFFTKITETFTKIQITEDKFEELFWDLEVAMLENNVAVEVIDKIKRDLKKELMAGRVSRSSVDELIASTLKKSIIELFDVEKINLIEKIKSKKDKPYIISIIGVNGSGKTTSIAKLTHKLQKEGLTVVLAASDTFRAAAIQQLEEHANRLSTKLIKHDYNSDPAAVAFDAINYAKAKNADVVLIDTAGRLHSNTNLMRELEKIIRVCKPDIKIFVGESITGNDCVEQAKEFDKAVGIDAIILAKADIDDKGGAAISVSYILQRPILYLGTGQTYDDLKEFDSNIIVDSLGL